MKYHIRIAAIFFQAQRETIEAQKKLAAEQQKRAESSSLANAQHQLQLQQQQQQQLQQQM